MSQGIFSALTFLENMIESISPKTDSHHGYVAVNKGTGYVSPLEDRPNSNRYFELVIDAFAQDDGQAGLSGRKRVRVNCRVRYDIPHDRGYLMRLINEDAAQLINTLKGPDYSTATTGIVSLIPLPTLLEPVLDSQGDVFAHIFTMQFDLLYLEA